MSTRRQSLLMEFIHGDVQSLGHSPSSSSSVTLASSSSSSSPSSPIRRSKSSSSPSSRPSTLPSHPIDPSTLPAIEYPIPQDPPPSSPPSSPPIPPIPSSTFTVQVRYQRGSSRLRCFLSIHSGMTVRQGVESACRFFGLVEDWNFCFWDGRSSSWLHDWLPIDSYPLSVLDNLFVRGKSSDYHEPTSVSSSSSSIFSQHSCSTPSAPSLFPSSSSGSRRNKSFSTRISSSSLGQLLFSRRQPFELRLRPHTLYLSIALFDPQDRILMTPTGLLPSLPIVSAEVFKDLSMELEGDLFAWITRFILTWSKSPSQSSSSQSNPSGRSGVRDSTSFPNLGQGLSSPSLPSPSPSRWSPLSLLPGGRPSNVDNVELASQEGLSSSSASIMSSSSSSSSKKSPSPLSIIYPSPSTSTSFPQDDSSKERLEALVREAFPSVLTELLRLLGLEQPGFLYDMPLALTHIQDSRLVLLYQYAGPKLRQSLESNDIVKKGHVRWRLPERLDDATYSGALGSSFRRQCLNSSPFTRKRSSSNPTLVSPIPSSQEPHPSSEPTRHEAQGARNDGQVQSPTLLSPPTSPTKAQGPSHGKTAPWGNSDGGDKGHSSTPALAPTIDLIPGHQFNLPTLPFHHPLDQGSGKGHSNRKCPSPGPPESASTPPFPMWREVLSGLHARSSSLGGGLYLGLMYTENTLQSINILLPKRRRTLPPLVKIRDVPELTEDEVAWLSCIHSGAHTLPPISLFELTSATAPSTHSRSNSKSQSTSTHSYISASGSSYHSASDSSQDLIGPFSVEFTLAYRLLQRRTQLNWSPKDLYIYGSISIDAAGLRFAADPARPCHARILLIVKPMRPVQDGLDRSFDQTKFDMYPLPLFESLHLHTLAPLETRRIGRLAANLQCQLQDRKAQLHAAQQVDEAMMFGQNAHNSSSQEETEASGSSSPSTPLPSGQGQGERGEEIQAEHRMSLAELFASVPAPTSAVSPPASARPSFSIPVSRSSSRSSRTATTTSTPESSFLVGEVERLTEEVHALRTQSTASLWTREMILWDRSRHADRSLPR
ncbi:MAG: hypothetical protein DHS80DRAFT_33010 [Piptocephalis tieghemiana]|nr:MAG: hypothetical protein DHS80DRAFT_33010 [Piptocephalis tieghemiana]